MTCSSIQVAGFQLLIHTQYAALNSNNLDFMWLAGLLLLHGGLHVLIYGTIDAESEEVIEFQNDQRLVIHIRHHMNVKLSCQQFALVRPET